MPANKKRKNKNQSINNRAIKVTPDKKLGDVTSNEELRIKTRDEKDNDLSNIYSSSRPVTVEDPSKLSDIPPPKKPGGIMSSANSSSKDHGISYLHKAIKNLDDAIRQYTVTHQDNNHPMVTQAKEAAEKVKAELSNYLKEFEKDAPSTKNDFTYQVNGSVMTLQEPNIYKEAEKQTLTLIEMIIKENVKQAGNLLEKYKKENNAHGYYLSTSGDVFLLGKKKKSIKKQSGKMVRKREVIKKLPEEMRSLFYVKNSIDSTLRDVIRFPKTMKGQKRKKGKKKPAKTVKIPGYSLTEIARQKNMLEYSIEKMINIINDAKEFIANGEVSKNKDSLSSLSSTTKQITEPEVKEMNHPTIPNNQLLSQPPSPLNSLSNPWTHPQDSSITEPLTGTENPFDKVTNPILSEQPNQNDPSNQRDNARVKAENTVDHHQDFLDSSDKHTIKDQNEAIDHQGKQTFLSKQSKQKTRLFSTLSSKKLTNPTLRITHKIFTANVEEKNTKKPSYSSTSTPTPVNHTNQPASVSNEIKTKLEQSIFSEQFDFDRDSNVLRTFLSAEDKNDPTYGEKQMILRRVLTMIDTVTTSYNPEKGMDHKNEPVTLPIGSVLLHGSMLKVDVPYVPYNESQDPNDFFYALIGGKENIVPSDIQGKSNTEHAMEIEAPVFHNMPSVEAALSGQYYGMNLGLGEPGEPVPANGDHGYLYMHWTPPSETKQGSLAISIKSAEANHMNHFGELNTKNTTHQFSASGGKNFSTDPALKKIHLLHASIPPKKISSLMQKLNNKDEVMKIDKKIFNKNLVKISMLASKKNIIKNENINKIEAKLNQYKKLIHALININHPLNKGESEELMAHISKCKKLLEKLNDYNVDDQSLQTRLDTTKKELLSLANMKGKIATYREEKKEDSIARTANKMICSTYKKGEEKIDVTQIIKKEGNQTVSEFTSSSIEALKKLVKERGNEGSKIMTLNEAIKWIEETLHVAYPKDTSATQKKLTLENYDSLDKSFLNYIILYCNKCRYPVQLNPPNSKLSRLNENEINEFKKFYETYENVLYAVEKKENITLEKNMSPTLIAHHVVSEEPPPNAMNNENESKEAKGHTLLPHQ